MGSEIFSIVLGIDFHSVIPRQLVLLIDVEHNLPIEGGSDELLEDLNLVSPS